MRPARLSLYQAALTLVLLSTLMPAAAEAQRSNERWRIDRATPYSYVPPGVSNPANVAIFKDSQPWGSDIDDAILIAHGIAFTVFNRDAIGNVDLSPFDKIILSNQQNRMFNTSVQENAPWFEAFVDDGGCLLYGLAHATGDLPVSIPGPGGYGLGKPGLNDVVSVDMPRHPIFNAPNTGVSLSGWGFSTHGDLLAPPEAMTLLSNADFTQGPAAAEHSIGGGTILATTQPYQFIEADPDYAENLVLYMPCGTVPVEPTTWGSIKSMYED